MDKDHPHVLLFEDNPSDLRLIKEAFRDGDPSVILDAVADGEEAVAFLRREDPHVNAVRPALILLDLNRCVSNSVGLTSGCKKSSRNRLIMTVTLPATDEISCGFPSPKAGGSVVTKCRVCGRSGDALLCAVSNSGGTLSLTSNTNEPSSCSFAVPS